jgi:hypothetical protein
MPFNQNCLLKPKDEKTKRILITPVFVLAYLLLISQAVSAEVIHSIYVKNDTILINSILILRSENPIDYWNLSISLPPKSTLLNATDELGKVDYSLKGNLVEIKTNAKKSKVRILNISYEFYGMDKSQGLTYAQLNLFGFVNDTTYAQIYPKIPYVFAPNADTEYLNNETKAKTLGPMNVILAYGGNKESEHYFTNSDINLSEVEKIYPVIEGVTGLKVPVKFGVSVLPEKEYLEDYKDWSAGTFNGLIFAKESKNDNEVTATIIHETVHGFNQFALGWDMTNISWFDEGTASYITSIANRILGEHQPELFGGNKVWSDKTMVYSLRPKKTPEDLWEYYANNQEFMNYWSPQSDYDREFGYAYSELFIRDYVKINGSALQKVYQNLLLINQTVYDKDKENKLFLDALGKNFTPCYSTSIAEIKNCTNTLNKMSFQIPASNGKELGQFVNDPEMPKTEGNYYEAYFKEIFQNIIDNLWQMYLFFAGFFG